MADFQSRPLSYTPVVDGRSPDMSAARDGVQLGAAQYARVKLTPRFASRSMFGVAATACSFRPRCPIQWFRSSIAMNRTLGLSPYFTSAAVTVLRHGTAANTNA